MTLAGGAGAAPTSSPASPPASPPSRAAARMAAMTGRRQARTRMLLEGPIGPTLAKLAAPNVLAMVVTAATSIAEGYFAGQLGVDALAGLALVFPFVMLTQMLSAGSIGGGISSSIARALGAGDAPRAERLIRHIALIAVGFATLMAVLMGVFGEAIFATLGGKGAALTAALAYAGVFFPGCLALWATNSTLSIIRGAGDMLFPSVILLICALAAIPIGGALALGWGPAPALGMAGLAAGPIAAFTVGGLIAIAYLALGRTGLSLASFFGRLERRLFWEVLRVGLSASINSMLTVVTIVVMLGLVGQIGVAALAGYGLGTRLEFLIIPIAFGIGAAMTSMVGANIGAGQRDRALRIAWTGSLAAAAIATTLGLTVALYPSLWLDLFLSEDSVAARAAGETYFAIVGPFYGFFAFGLAFYFASQGAERLRWPIVASSARTIIAIVGGIIMVRHFELGATGVFSTIAVAMLSFGLVTGVAIRITRWR